MIKNRVAPPKCLFHVATQTEKSIYSNRTICTFGPVKNWHLLTPYSYITKAYNQSSDSSPCCVYAVEAYNVYDITVK